jgi:AcrR family transcriptional regulator
MSSRKPPTSISPKLARTRTKLLDAAAELFSRDGIAAVSLDEIARHAGVTKGSIYGNFENKDDLVVAVAIERTARPRPIFTPDAPLREQLRALVKQAAGKTPKAVKQLRFLTELDLYALTHEAVRVRLRGFAEERYRKSAENVKAALRKEALPLPPLQFAIAVHAVMNGLLYQRAFFPEVVTDAMVLKVLEALTAGKRNPGEQDVSRR